MKYKKTPVATIIRCLCSFYCHVCAVLLHAPSSPTSLRPFPSSLPCFLPSPSCPLRSFSFCAPFSFVHPVSPSWPCPFPPPPLSFARSLCSISVSLKVFSLCQLRFGIQLSSSGSFIVC